MKPTIKDTLLEAADILETMGWTQGSYARDVWGNPRQVFDDTAVQFCALGALSCATRFMNVDESIDVLTKYLYKKLSWNDSEISISKWNDQLGRTREDVISTMRDCAATL